ncbi:hypothetical protein Tco_1517305 [Tanacetum coccineum]
MATLEFCDTHNMVAYLEKPEGSAEFHQIIDFLTAIHYALTKNPTIYASFVKQFWTTATTSTNVTGEIELTASIDGQAKTIIEASLRRHLKLEDNGGITSLPNTQIFDQLALMGSSTSLLPFIETTPTAEEPALMPHESPLQSVHSLGHDEGSVSLNELMALLIKRVKKLEKQVKTGKARRRTKIVLSEDKTVEEDSSKQGRSLIEELDMDADFSLVPPHDAEIQEKISDDTEVLLEEEVTTADTALNTASIPFSTASATPEVSTANEQLVCIRRSAEKRNDKGKAIMIEDEFVQKKSKKQLEKERLSHKEAVRLQEQIDEEERKRIARDAEIAKQLQEEYDKARKKEAVTEVDTAHVIDWNDPSVIRYHALQNRSRSVAKVKKNMIMYLKNQGGYKMKIFKEMSYDDIRPIFEKVWDQIHSFVPMDSEEEVQRLKRARQDVETKPAKRQRTEEVSKSVQKQTDEEPKTDKLSQEQLNQMVIIVPDEGINVEDLQTIVHRVSTEKGQDIFMLVEKDYPLTKGLATLMLSNKLRVDQQSKLADELLTKIYNIANKPRTGGLLGFRASTLSTADS